MGSGQYIGKKRQWSKTLNDDSFIAQSRFDAYTVQNTI